MIHKIQDLGSIGMIMHGRQEEMISLLNALMVCRIVSIRLLILGFWLLGVESRDFSNAEKKRTACKAEQIHKMTTFFT